MMRERKRERERQIDPNAIVDCPNLSLTHDFGCQGRLQAAQLSIKN